MQGSGLRDFVNFDKIGKTECTEAGLNSGGAYFLDVEQVTLVRGAYF